MSEQQAVITSTANRRIVDARKLTQRKHRRRQGKFIVEGVQLVRMGLERGWVPDQVFYCAEHLDSAVASDVLPKLERAGASVYAVSTPVMDRLSTRDVSKGMVATFPMREMALADIVDRDDCLILVLDRLQDLGNVGTLVRTADAVGAAGVVLVEPCADPFDPKTVRATMGSLFNLPVIQITDILEIQAFAAARKLAVVGADVYEGIVWGQGTWQARQALVLGNEAHGLSPDVRDLVTHWARLPMRGGAESLNVAVAGGVLMYAWLRAQELGSVSN